MDIKRKKLENIHPILYNRSIYSITTYITLDLLYIKFKTKSHLKLNNSRFKNCGPFKIFHLTEYHTLCILKPVKLV